MGLTELDRVELVIEERETNRRRLIAVEALGWPVEREALDTACALLKLSSLLDASHYLAPLMVEKVFEVVRAVAAEGMTILLVEQNAKLALEVCSRGYVMESGKITLADNSAALLADRRVRAAYLGE